MWFTEFGDVPTANNVVTVSPKSHENSSGVPSAVVEAVTVKVTDCPGTASTGRAVGVPTITVPRRGISPKVRSPDVRLTARTKIIEAKRVSLPSLKSPGILFDSAPTVQRELSQKTGPRSGAHFQVDRSAIIWYSSSGLRNAHTNSADPAEPRERHPPASVVASGTRGDRRPGRPRDALRGSPRRGETDLVADAARRSHRLRQLALFRPIVLRRQPAPDQPRPPRRGGLAERGGHRRARVVAGGPRPVRGGRRLQERPAAPRLLDLRAGRVGVGPGPLRGVPALDGLAGGLVAVPRAEGRAPRRGVGQLGSRGEIARAGGAGGGAGPAGRGDPLPRFRPARVRASVGRAATLLRRPRDRPDRRRSVLRPVRQRRGLGAAGPLRSRTPRAADAGGGSAARRFRQGRPALGFPALRLGADAPAGLRVVGGALPHDARALHRGAH